MNTISDGAYHALYQVSTSTAFVQRISGRGASLRSAEAIRAIRLLQLDVDIGNILVLVGDISQPVARARGKYISRDENRVCPTKPLASG